MSSEKLSPAANNLDAQATSTPNHSSQTNVPIYMRERTPLFTSPEYLPFPEWIKTYLESFELANPAIPFALRGNDQHRTLEIVQEGHEFNLPEGFKWLDDNHIQFPDPKQTPLEVIWYPPALLDDVYVVTDKNFHGQPKQKASPQEKERIIRATKVEFAKRLDRQATPEMKEIKDYEIEASPEAKDFFQTIVNIINQERAQFDLPPRNIDINRFIHLYPQETFIQHTGMPAAGFFNSRWQDFNGIEMSTPLLQAEIMIHELVHAEAYQAQTIRFFNQKQYATIAYRTGYSYNSYNQFFTIIEEAVTQMCVCEIFNRDEIKNHPFLKNTFTPAQENLNHHPDYSFFSNQDGHLDDQPLTHYSGPVGLINDQEQLIPIGSAYTLERQYLTVFVNYLIELSGHQLTQENVYLGLKRAHYTGEWKPFAKLIDYLLGPQAFAKLGRASTNSNDFRDFVDHYVSTSILDDTDDTNYF